MNEIFKDFLLSLNNDKLEELLKVTGNEILKEQSKYVDKLNIDYTEYAPTTFIKNFKERKVEDIYENAFLFINEEEFEKVFKYLFPLKKYKKLDIITMEEIKVWINENS